MKPLRLFAFHLLCLAVSLAFLSDITQAEGPLKTTAPQTQPQQGTRIIQFANNLLTVKVKDMSLAGLLQEIARQDGFKRFKVRGNATLANKISIRFQDLPLDQGIQRILRGTSYSLIYAQPKWEKGKDSSTTLEEVRIFCEGKGEQSFGFDSLEGKRSLLSMTLKGLIQQALHGEDAMTRAKAILALGETGDSEAIAALEQALLEDTEQDVREAALGALVQLGPDHAVGPLARALAREKSEEVREDIIQALVWLKDERAIEPLARVLQEDKDSELRETALMAMMQLGGEGLIDPLASAIKDKDSDVRELAFIALAEIGGVKAKEAIKQALEHEDEDIREMMTELLGQMQKSDEKFERR